MAALERTIQAALPSVDTDPTQVEVVGQGDLPAWFEVTELAVAAIGAAAAGLVEVATPPTSERPTIRVDRRLASFWFAWSLRPQGWKVPPPWDPIAGDYATRDGWIKLHTNAPHHRNAALAVLGDCEDRDAVAAAVATWDAAALETQIVDAGGCAAEMRSLDAWQQHPQGAAVAAEPLVAWDDYSSVAPAQPAADAGRPLRGVRVLDLTRVLAGPVAGRFLAAYGADVLRIDPPWWDEPAVVPEVTLGKRCAGLDLRAPRDRTAFEALVRGADLMLHGYRPGALDGLGFDAQALRRLNPALVDVSLCAYGWSGPWRHRRGFDSLVQMSSGIAAYGMARSGEPVPTPLPVQALDHATGYLLAAAALHALRERWRAGRVQGARLSLARVAHLLAETRREALHEGLDRATAADLARDVEQTDWGPARRVAFPVHIDAMPAAWDRPATRLRTAAARW